MVESTYGLVGRMFYAMKSKLGDDEISSSLAVHTTDTSMRYEEHAAYKRVFTSKASQSSMQIAHDVVQAEQIT